MATALGLAGRLRSAWLTTIKHSLNHLTRRVAHSRHGPFTIVRHVGRRSGRVYETPIIVAPMPGGFAVELTYGTDVDWYRNVRAAGRCELEHHHIVSRIVGLEPLSAHQGLAAFPASQRRVLRMLHRRHFVKFLTAPDVADTRTGTQPPRS
jgi:deazaflavin-dependent oxidoreductase (nitroreductase family)